MLMKLNFYGSIIVDMIMAKGVVRDNNGRVVMSYATICIELFNNDIFFYILMWKN